MREWVLPSIVTKFEWFQWNDNLFAFQIELNFATHNLAL
jgi:hypothetical protein